MARTTVIVVAVVIATGLAGIGLTRRLVDRARPESGVAELTSGRGVTIKLSDKPVALPAMHVTDFEGKAISNETLKGKVVLINFWATWCGPCREEIPMLSALQEYYRDRLVIGGLSIDERPASEVKAFAADLLVTYPVAMSTREIEQAFGGVSAVPSTFLVNPDGQIVQRHIGMLQPRQTEHEVRVLAGLSSDATVETVKDTGQVLLSNAAYATEIPGVDLASATPAQREAILKKLNTEHCSCGCGLTLAQCRINDPSCQVSLPIAQAIAKDATRKDAH